MPMTQQPSNPGDGKEDIAEKLIDIARRLHDVPRTMEQRPALNGIRDELLELSIQSRHSGGERAAVVEECARVAETVFSVTGPEPYRHAAKVIAADIRSLSRRGAAELEGEQP